MSSSRKTTFLVYNSPKKFREFYLGSKKLKMSKNLNFADRKQIYFEKKNTYEV